jgi:hypothetical protein
MDHVLLILFSRFQPRGSNNANSENNNANGENSSTNSESSNGTATTATTSTTTDNSMTRPPPICISGLSYPNDAYAFYDNLSTETLPKYSREGEDLEMAVLPTYKQATKGFSRNKLGSKSFHFFCLMSYCSSNQEANETTELRRHCRKERVLALFVVFMCLILAAAIWATTKKE